MRPRYPDTGRSDSSIHHREYELDRRIGEVVEEIEQSQAHAFRLKRSPFKARIRISRDNPEMESRARVDSFGTVAVTSDFAIAAKQGESSGGGKPSSHLQLTYCMRERY
jgi:hypothetical protein